MFGVEDRCMMGWIRRSWWGIKGVMTRVGNGLGKGRFKGMVTRAGNGLGEGRFIGSLVRCKVPSHWVIVFNDWRISTIVVSCEDDILTCFLIAYLICCKF